MKLRGRVAKVRAVLASRARPDLAFMAVWMRAGSSSSEGRPPGLYQAGGVIDLVSEGEEPDPAVLARLRARTTPSALTIRLGPEVIDPPPELP
jgi:hypothetical protein